MTTHGGSRQGSGRPQGGVSQARRLITDAIHQGLAQAGRKKYPGQVSQADQEQAAVQTAAMIVDDMIQAGQGNDVLKLWAVVAMKETDGDKGSSKSSLADALSRLPAAGRVTDVTRLGMNALEAPETERGTTHIEREGPHDQAWFAPQNSLPLDDPATDQESMFCDHDRAQAR